MKKRVMKILLTVIGSLLILNAIVMLITSNLNIGIIAEFILGVAVAVYGIFNDKFIAGIPCAIKGIFWIGVGVVAVGVTLLLGYGVTDSISGNEDAVVVLGSGIRGELLTVGLKNRLDRAVEIYNENPDTVIIVSGGQGPQEDITEALAMERYLLRCGVDSERIIKEEKATSTYENFVYSKQILDGLFGEEYDVAFVTNEYHIYRAGSLAKIAGLADVTHAHSNTVWYTVIPSCIRECMAVVKLWIFKQ
ncbi:MAG: YdcF family protein [Clostridia bacterium]|nr:YdcF family protein [Clostridia bacterium]